MIKNFLSNVKSYIDYIMTLGFKDLFRHFISLVVVILIALIVYIPIGLVRDFVIESFGSLVTNPPIVVITIIGIIFDAISIVCAVLCFMYMFNQRYKDVYKDEILNAGKEDKKDKINPVDLNKKIEQKIELPELDLPKKK